MTGKRSFLKMKERPISYAAHLDGHIYSKYGYDLSELLEQVYREDFGESVLAYRHHDPPKSNVHFASEAFEMIRNVGECDVIAIDVEDFFGSLDHAHLKRSWSELLGGDGTLPANHFAVYKAITRFAWVDLESLRKCLSRDVRRRRRRPGDRVCTPQEFRELVRPELQKNPMGKGIPQGSPISAVLANLYMARTDRSMYLELSSLKCAYRRYSDDILLICPQGVGQVAERVAVSALAALGLSVQNTKTVRVAFRSTLAGMRGFKLGEDGAHTQVPIALQYLGLTWDGSAMRLRSTTIARVLRKMTRAIRIAERLAGARGEQRIHRSKLYRRFSRLGRSARIFGPQPASHRRNRNFVHYGLMAGRVSGSSAIDRQVGKLWLRLEQEIAKAERRLQKSHKSSV